MTDRYISFHDDLVSIHQFSRQEPATRGDQEGPSFDLICSSSF